LLKCNYADDDRISEIEGLVTNMEELTTKMEH